MMSNARANIEILRRQITSEQTRMSDLRSTSPQESVVQGKFLVNGAGEADKTIRFPVLFTEVPFMTFGFEITSDRGILKGLAPTISATVYNWAAEDREPYSRMYTGAEVKITSTGPPAIKFIVNWSAAGMVIEDFR